MKNYKFWVSAVIMIAIAVTLAFTIKPSLAVFIPSLNQTIWISNEGNNFNEEDSVQISRAFWHDRMDFPDDWEVRAQKTPLVDSIMHDTLLNLRRFRNVPDTLKRAELECRIGIVRRP